MAGDTRGDEPVLTSDQTTEGGLGPAEVHRVTRQQLERLAIPWGLKPVDAQRLTQQMRTHAYAPCEIILPRRARADFLGLIVKGQVAVYTGPRWAAQQVAILLPGSTFGDDMLGENHPSDTMLQALTRCEVQFLQRADLEALASERRAERQQVMFWGLVGASALALLVCLVALLALSLPWVRQMVALVPMGLGQWCSQQSRGNDAPQAYDRCVEWTWTLAANLTPADAMPFLALGTFYFEQGEVLAAEQSFEAARALTPDLAEVHNNLGLIYAEQGEHEQAVAAFQRALDLEPGTSAIEQNLGRSLQAMHAYDEALIHYQQAMAFGEPKTSTLVNMAIGYYETGQSRKAAELAEQVLRDDETLAPAHMVLGAVALESRQPEAALGHLRRAIALDDSYSQAHFYLGLVHKALDQPTEAIAAFEQALAIADDDVIRVQIRRHLKELYEAEEQDRSP